MREKVAVRRRTSDVMVSVTQVSDGVTVYWQERVVGATPGTIRTAVRICRRRCAMLTQGVALSERSEQ